MSKDIQRKKILIKGVVQGVGFRPFIYRNAVKRDLKGFVMNTSKGVEIEIEGESSVLDDFIDAIKTESPPQSKITSLKTAELDYKNELEFMIVPSNKQKNRSVLITPDISTCAECVHELFNPEDRRYQYPFINCTNCGPRYTIIKDIPYDRPKTTMAEFKMCKQCRSEYEDPLNRRFHAQPNACPVCGPHIWLSDSSGKEISIGNTMQQTVKLLEQGKIIAIKGLGGFHLACDAKNDESVTRLRLRKRREEEPFAVMAGSIETVKKIAVISKQEVEILQSPEKPIVLLRKNSEYYLSEHIAPKNKYIGVMLPYTPLHFLLFNFNLDVLVMTSGNISDEPIAKSNKEALDKLYDIADYFLFHNRAIQVRADDSVTRFINNIPRPIRRSRGYVPFPIFMRNPSPSVLAVGGELKNCFCLTREDQAFLSQHIGDLENSETLSFFIESIDHLKNILQIKPEAVIHDLHPDYLSTKWAKTIEGLPKIGIQHHHAHIAACLADNGRNDKVIGLAMDGVGYGDDGKIWGGEVLIADIREYQRVGHFDYRSMPGGTIAIKKPWRMVVAYLYHLFKGNEKDCLKNLEGIPFMKEIAEEKIIIIMNMIKNSINIPMTSSLGRLFDAVAALVGVRTTVHYEGQAAIELEMQIGETSMPDDDRDVYLFDIINSNDRLIISPDNVIYQVLQDKKSGLPVNRISWKFHAGLVRLFIEISKIIRKQTNLNCVALSGGCFLNRFLLENLVKGLEKENFEVLTHSQVPTNDGCLALGQAVAGIEILKNKKKNLD